MKNKILEENLEKNLKEIPKISAESSLKTSPPTLFKNSISDIDEELIIGNYYWFYLDNVVFYAIYEGEKDKFVDGNYILHEIKNLKTKEKFKKNIGYSISRNRIFENRMDCVKSAVKESKEMGLFGEDETTIIINVEED